MRSSFLGLPSLQQTLHFTAPFYIANCLIIMSYWPMRLQWTQHGLSKYARAGDIEALPKYEEQCAQAILTIVSAKLIWQKSRLDSFVADLFLYIKGALITVTFFADQRLCAYFCLASLIVYMTAPQPYFDYVGDSNVELLTTDNFPDRVLNDKSGIAWLVLFFTPNRYAQGLNADFAALSVQFAEGQRFGRVNVVGSPDVLADHVESYALYQGSIVVKFQKGTKIGCLPDNTAEANASTLSVDSIKQKFGLGEATDDHGQTPPAPNRTRR